MAYGRVCARKWRVFLHRAAGLRTISRNAAGKDELPDVAAGAVDDADRFHHARGAGNVDLPHALEIEHAGLLRVENEGEMDDGLRAGCAQQLDQWPGTKLRGRGPSAQSAPARKGDGGRMSTPTTRKSESNGSSLVPRFPETPVTRTVRLEGMVTWATLRRSAKQEALEEPG